jgi:hypothetical protein
MDLSLGLGDFLAPHAGKRGLNLLLKACDEFAVGGDQCLLGFDFGDDGLLYCERWKWNSDRPDIPK